MDGRLSSLSDLDDVAGLSKVFTHVTLLPAAVLFLAEARGFGGEPREHFIDIFVAKSGGGDFGDVFVDLVQGHRRRTAT